MAEEIKKEKADLVINTPQPFSPALERSPRHTHTGLDSEQIEFNDINGIYNYNVTYNPASLVDGAGETTDFTAIGARVSDFVLISAPYNLQGITATGYVSGSGTATIRLQNESGGTINLASGSWKIKIIQQ